MKIVVPRLYLRVGFRSILKKNIASQFLEHDSAVAPFGVRPAGCPNIGVWLRWVYRHCIIKWSPGQFYLEHCSPPRGLANYCVRQIFAYRSDNNKRPESLFPLDTNPSFSLSLSFAPLESNKAAAVGLDFSFLSPVDRFLSPLGLFLIDSNKFEMTRN